MSKPYTRLQYMDKVCTHQEYYSQFVNANILALVKRHIGLDRIKASTDRYMNDIPLKEWDRLIDMTRTFLNVKLWQTCECPHFLGTKSYLFSSSCNVCILKAAAQILKDEETV